TQFSSCSMLPVPCTRTAKTDRHFLTIWYYRIDEIFVDNLCSLLWYYQYEEKAAEQAEPGRAGDAWTRPQRRVARRPAPPQRAGPDRRVRGQSRPPPRGHRQPPRPRRPRNRARQ